MTSATRPPDGFRPDSAVVTMFVLRPSRSPARRGHIAGISRTCRSAFPAAPISILPRDGGSPGLKRDDGEVRRRGPRRRCPASSRADRSRQASLEPTGWRPNCPGSSGSAARPGPRGSGRNRPVACGGGRGYEPDAATSGGSAMRWVCHAVGASAAMAGEHVGIAGSALPAGTTASTGAGRVSIREVSSCTRTGVLERNFSLPSRSSRMTAKSLCFKPNFSRAETWSPSVPDWMFSPGKMSSGP